jgi:hypothetical protein
VDIFSRERITYAKETQTSNTIFTSTNSQASRAGSLDDLKQRVEYYGQCYDHQLAHICIEYNFNLVLYLSNQDIPIIYDTLQWEDEFHLNSSPDEHDNSSIICLLMLCSSHVLSPRMVFNRLTSNVCLMFYNKKAWTLLLWKIKRVGFRFFSGHSSQKLIYSYQRIFGTARIIRLTFDFEKAANSVVCFLS